MTGNELIHDPDARTDEFVLCSLAELGQFRKAEFMAAFS